MNAAKLVVGVSVLLLLGSAAALGELAVSADIDASGQGYNGVVMVNQAAGTGQQQANARALAAGDHAGAQINVEQAQDLLSPDQRALNASAHIGGASFSQGAGVLGVNQGAGIAISRSMLSASSLARCRKAWMTAGWHKVPRCHQ